MKAEIGKGAGVFCGVNRCIYIDIDSDLRMHCFIYANGIEFILIALWLIISWRGECFHSDCSTFIWAFFFPSDVRYAEEPKLMWLYGYCQWLHGKPLSDCSFNLKYTTWMLWEPTQWPVCLAQETQLYQAIKALSSLKI